MDCTKEKVSHSFNVGESKPLDILACEEYSSNSILVSEGQCYTISCDDEQRWKDFIITCTPKGYFNPFAIMAGMRVKKTKCFCLCGVYNKKDSTGFPIGMNSTFIVTEGCTDLSFFANDTKNFYFNNHGSISINILRLK